MSARDRQCKRMLGRIAVLGCTVLISVVPLEATPAGSPVEVISPSHPETFDVCGCPKISQRLSWDDKAGILKGVITYSTVWGASASPVSSNLSRAYVLDFPSVKRSANNDLYVETNRRKVAIGHFKVGAAGQRVRINQGVNLVAHRVEGRIGGEIIVSPDASNVVVR